MDPAKIVLLMPTNKDQYPHTLGQVAFYSYRTEQYDCVTLTEGRPFSLRAAHRYSTSGKIHNEIQYHIGLNVII